MDPPAALRLEPVPLVSQQEVALLVLSYLRENHYEKSAEAFTQEAAGLIKAMTIPTNRQAKALIRIITEYVALKQQEKDKLDVLRAFAGEANSPMHRTLAALTTLLDDYRTVRQSHAPLNSVPPPMAPQRSGPPPAVAAASARPMPTAAPSLAPAPSPAPARTPLQPQTLVSRASPVKAVAAPAPVIPTPPPLPPVATAASGHAVRRKAFRPRKIVLPAAPADVVAPAAASAEPPTDSGIALMLRDHDLQQKLAERVAQHIATDHPAMETTEPQPEDMLEGILASLHDDPDMAHLFDVSDVPLPQPPKPAAAASQPTPKERPIPERLEEFSFKAPKRQRTSGGAPPPTPPPPPPSHQSVDEFLNSLTYKQPPT